MSNSNKSNDEVFDHDLQDFDEYFDDGEHEKETLNDARGVSELSKTKKISPKGQKALIGFLVLAGLLVCGLLFAKINSGGGGEAESKEPPAKSSFDKPARQTFGDEWAAYAASEDAGVSSDMPMSADIYAKTKNNYGGEDVSGIAGTSPEPVMPVYDGGTASNVSAPVEPVSVSPVVPENVPMTREQRIFASGFGNVSPQRTRMIGGGGNDENVSGIGSSLTGRAEKDKLVVNLSPATLDGTAAVRLKNRDYIITKGNTIDCVLNTKFNSTVVGMLSCTVTRNIYGASGRVVLIDRGSKVSGEYKGGIEQGQNRVFVLWNRIETPRGVIININSPAAGALGEGGMDGRIDTKFWARFGGAMLVSLVSDMGKAASEAAAEKAIGGNVHIERTSDTAQDMMKAELEKSVDIPPSLIKHQGDRLSIYVARDVYFGGVYGLRAKR